MNNSGQKYLTHNSELVCEEEEGEKWDRDGWKGDGQYIVVRWEGEGVADGWEST